MGKNTPKFFHVRVRPPRKGELASNEYTLKQPKPDDATPLPKKYFAVNTLRELVMEYVPHEKTKSNVGLKQAPAVLTPEDTEERECFLDFVSGLLQVRCGGWWMVCRVLFQPGGSPPCVQMDPLKRWSPTQAMTHPFITKAPRTDFRLAPDLEATARKSVLLVHTP